MIPKLPFSIMLLLLAVIFLVFNPVDLCGRDSLIVTFCGNSGQQSWIPAEGVACRRGICYKDSFTEVSMNQKGAQDYYEDRFAHCYGCGRLNQKGMQLKTRWDGEETVTRYTPESHHTALPGFIYGGLLASLIDCHGTGSSALAYARANGIELREFNAPRFVTVSLQVSFKRPTPLGPELEVRGTIREVTEKKVIVDAVLYAAGEACAEGEIVSVLVPENFGMK